MRGRTLTFAVATLLILSGSAHAGLFDFGKSRKPHRSSFMLKTAPFAVPDDLAPVIEEAAAKYSLDPKLLSAVVFRESAFNRLAVSRRGARGLMQLMPKTAAYLGVTDSFDVRQNVFGGAKYLRELSDQFGGNLEMMLGAYNAGPTAVKRAGIATPTPESIEYVAAVMTYYRASR